jgi:pectate lyase
MRILAGFLSALVVLTLGAGCAKKDTSTTATQTPSETSAPPSAAPPAASGEHVAGEGEQISTAGSASEIMARADQEETELNQIITNAQLNVVHQKAFAIRDLVAAAADKATITGADKAKLAEHVSKIKSLASDLDAAGDAGNLSKTKAEFADLQAELQAIRQLLGTHQ